MPLSYAIRFPAGRPGVEGLTRRFARNAPTKTSTPAASTSPSVAYEPRYPSTIAQRTDRRVDTAGTPVPSLATVVTGLRLDSFVTGIGKGHRRRLEMTPGG